jgi:hypothetical protein
MKAGLHQVPECNNFVTKEPLREQLVGWPERSRDPTGKRNLINILIEEGKLKEVKHPRPGTRPADLLEKC